MHDDLDDDALSDDEPDTPRPWPAFGQVHEYDMDLSMSEKLCNWLVLAQSGWGKTTLLYNALMPLLLNYDNDPELHTLPVLLLDGSGTLARNIFLFWQQAVDFAERSCAARGTRIRPGLRERVVYMKIEDENSCGVSFDLGRALSLVDSTGWQRMETVKERVQAVVGALAYMTEDSESFRLVHKYAKAGLAVLFAARKRAEDLPRLYAISSEAFRDEIRKTIEREYAVDLATKPEFPGERYIWRQWHVVQELFAQVGRNGNMLEKQVGSTLRNFAWLHDDFVDYFNAPVLRLDEFVAGGGVLLVETCGRDQHANANARAAVYSMYQAAIAGAARRTPSLCIIDEQRGLNADLYAQHVVAGARNARNYHWFALHSTEQLGKQFPLIWQACQRRILGSIAEEPLARLALFHTSDLRPNRLFVPKISRTTGTSDDAAEAATAGTSSTLSEDLGGAEVSQEARYDVGSSRHFLRRLGPLAADGIASQFEQAAQRTAALSRQEYDDAEGMNLTSLPKTPLFRYASFDNTRAMIVRQRPARTSEAEGTSASRTLSRRNGSMQSETQSHDRIGIPELVLALTGDLVRQPPGSALHIEIGRPTLSMQHPRLDLPLDAPDAEEQLAHYVLEQKVRLEDEYEQTLSRADETDAEHQPPRPATGPASLH